MTHTLFGIAVLVGSLAMSVSSAGAAEFALSKKSVGGGAAVDIYKDPG
jgi:hypothetical protein